MKRAKRSPAEETDAASAGMVSRSGEPRHVHLTEILDLKAAAPLRDEILAARGGALRLDASRVQRLGGLCLQVLLSAQRTWQVDGASLRIADPSPEFQEALTLFGATSLTANFGASL